MKDPFKNVPRSKIKAGSIGMKNNKNSRGISFPAESFKELERLVG